MRRIFFAALAAVIFFTGSHMIVGRNGAAAAAGTLVLRSRFTTNFETSGPARRENIRLAAGAIDRQEISAGGEGSFNGMTGRRTAERGYQEAKIIFNGVYVPGFGGGVCQVSTTLYNALLLADIEIAEVHSHTLCPSYVAPSFDAMVNFGTSDLRFTNNTASAILIRAVVKQDDLVVEIYGEPKGCAVKRISEVVKTVPPPAMLVIPDENGEYQDKVIYRGERYVLRTEADGLYSKGYLLRIKGGVQVVELIRSDYYAPVQRVEIEGTLQSN